MIDNINSKIILNNGVEIPRLGLGVFRAEEGEVLVHAVKFAIQNGYRCIDGAAIYGNEISMGKGIQEGMKAAGIQREDLFITSKVWNADLGYEKTIQAYEASLERLGLEYLDLYLIHWPVEGKYKEAWRALEYLYESGKVKAIGVSNFQIHHLEDLLKDAKVVPVINQVELHPCLIQEELREYCKKHNIQVEAWSPLMTGQLLDNEVLVDIAKNYEKTTAQVILRWDLQHGIVTIPKSTNEKRILENANIFDFELSEEEMQRINALNQNLRIGPDPDNFDF